LKNIELGYEPVGPFMLNGDEYKTLTGAMEVAWCTSAPSVITSPARDGTVWTCTVSPLGVFTLVA
jgi:hypothetical protein